MMQFRKQEVTRGNFGPLPRRLDFTRNHDAGALP